MRPVPVNEVSSCMRAVLESSVYCTSRGGPQRQEDLMILVGQLVNALTLAGGR